MEDVEAFLPVGGVSFYPSQTAAYRSPALRLRESSLTFSFDVFRVAPPDQVVAWSTD